MAMCASLSWPVGTLGMGGGSGQAAGRGRRRLWEARHHMSDQAIRTTTGGAPRGLDRLLDLQELDLAIDRLQARLFELEGGDDLRRAREARGAAEGRLGELRLSLESLASQQRRLEGDIDSISRKI